MAALPRVKMALDMLCEFAERSASARTDQERFNVDQGAYEYLAYSGFAGDQWKRLAENYRRMREEFIH